MTAHDSTLSEGQNEKPESVSADSFKITFGDDVAYERGWPSERVTVYIGGKLLCRKDGGPRKFKTRYAARKAAEKVINWKEVRQ